jgi:polyribonucleotide nucleotidyltransferase
MDIKVKGLSTETMRAALAQARFFTGDLDDTRRIALEAITPKTASGTGRANTAL